MTFDTTVNTHLLLLRIIERALHQPEGWSLRCGRVEVPAQVTVSDHSVTIAGVFPVVDESIALPSVISIHHGGIQLWARPVAHCGHEGFGVSWTWEVEPSLAGQLG